MVRGYTLFGEALAREGIDTGFYIMGGPINDAVKAAISGGVRMIDTRHEQAAAMSAQAYARVRCKPGICMGASGPGTINLTLGLANARSANVLGAIVGGVLAFALHFWFRYRAGTLGFGPVRTPT